MPCDALQSADLPPSFHEYAGDLSNVTTLLHTGAINHHQAQAMIAAKWGMGPAVVRIEVRDVEAPGGFSFPK